MKSGPQAGFLGSESRSVLSAGVYSPVCLDEVWSTGGFPGLRVQVCTLCWSVLTCLPWWSLVHRKVSWAQCPGLYSLLKCTHLSALMKSGPQAGFLGSVSKSVLSAGLYLPVCLDEVWSTGRFPGLRVQVCTLCWSVLTCLPWRSLDHRRVSWAQCPGLHCLLECTHLSALMKSGPQAGFLGSVSRSVLSAGVYSPVCLDEVWTTGRFTGLRVQVCTLWWSVLTCLPWWSLDHRQVSWAQCPGLYSLLECTLYSPVCLDEVWTTGGFPGLSVQVCTLSWSVLTCLPWWSLVHRRVSWAQCPGLYSLLESLRISGSLCKLSAGKISRKKLRITIHFVRKCKRSLFYSACSLGGFNVSNLMGITRRMIDNGKKITFYFLQNVWKCTVFFAFAF